MRRAPAFFILMDPLHRYYWQGAGKGFRQLGDSLPPLSDIANFFDKADALVKAAQVSAQILLSVVAVPVRVA
jgi:hypothetical protein